jgi:[ribosomal protein S18]-alanine N-acetyltransferase
MTDFPVLEFRRLSPALESGLAAFFADLTAAGDDRYFHPHPFTAAEAARLCLYAGPDLYYAAVADRVLGYGLLRGWDEGYSVPSLGIAVHPAARGTGIAGAFMHFLHSAAAARRAPKVRLKVYSGNTAAKRLYERLGYEFAGESRGQLVGYFTLEARAHAA